jgi:hypothetical protein
LPVGGHAVSAASLGEPGMRGVTALPAGAAFAVLDSRLEGSAIQARLSSVSLWLVATREQAQQDQGALH